MNNNIPMPMPPKIEAPKAPEEPKAKRGRKPSKNKDKKQKDKRKRKTDRVILQNQAREIIAKVYDFMKTEATQNHPRKITDARWRTARATGVSEKTVTRILKERKDRLNSVPKPPPPPPPPEEIIEKPVEMEKKPETIVYTSTQVQLEEEIPTFHHFLCL